MLTFFEWLNNIDTHLAEWAGIYETVVSRSSNANKPIEQRMAKGKDVDEKYVRFNLYHKNPSIKVFPVSKIQDKQTKIDGKLEDGRWIGIKNSDTSNNQVVFQLLLDHDKNKPLLQQMENLSQKGRDAKSQAKVTYLLSSNRRQIFELDAEMIKLEVEEAANEFADKNIDQGTLKESYRASNGLALVPTYTEGDEVSEYKVLVYVPATENNILNVYPADPQVDQEPIPGVLSEEGFTIPPQEVKVNPNFQKILDALETEKVTSVVVPPQKNKERTEEYAAFAKSKGLAFRKEKLGNTDIVQKIKFAKTQEDLKS